MASLSVVVTFVIGQAPTMISGVPGANYIFTVMYAILTSFSLLIYEGRRWSFFIQTTVFTLLIIPTHFGGTAFDPTSKLHFMVTSFFIDVLFNSFYAGFKKINKLRIWAVLGAVTFWSMNPLWGIIIKSTFFYPPDYISTLVHVVLVLFPVIVIEAIVGGWIGYKTFNRIKNINS
ncbi:MAG: hypothetical protein WC325_04190 [Candidatus Bathyarchaeia archaeon]